MKLIQKSFPPCGFNQSNLRFRISDLRCRIRPISKLFLIPIVSHLCGFSPKHAPLASAPAGMAGAFCGADLGDVDIGRDLGAVFIFPLDGEFGSFLSN